MPFFSFGFDVWLLVAKFTPTNIVHTTVAAAENTMSSLPVLQRGSL